MWAVRSILLCLLVSLVLCNLGGTKLVRGFSLLNSIPQDDEFKTIDQYVRN